MGKQYAWLTQLALIVVEHMLVDRYSKAENAKHLNFPDSKVTAL